LSIKGLIPAEWVAFQMRGVASTPEAFRAFVRDAEIDPDTDWFTPTENKRLLLKAILQTQDEHYGHSKSGQPFGATELSFRVLNSGTTVRDALNLLQNFTATLMPNHLIRWKKDDQLISVSVEVDGLSAEDSGAVELTYNILLAFALSAFSGNLIKIEQLISRSTKYTNYMHYNKDLDCPVIYGDFSGFQFHAQHLDLPRRVTSGATPLNDAIRWGLLADKMRPIMDKTHLPLIAAESLKSQLEASLKERNVDLRQKRRVTRDETGYTLRDLQKSIKAAQAMTLIATTNKSAGEIASDLEFSDERSFRRFFVDVTGCTPAEYRTVYQEVAAGEGRNIFRTIIEEANEALRLSRE